MCKKRERERGNGEKSQSVIHQHSVCVCLGERALVLPEGERKHGTKGDHHQGLKAERERVGGECDVLNRDGEERLDVELNLGVLDSLVDLLTGQEGALTCLDAFQTNTSGLLITSLQSADAVHLAVEAHLVLTGGESIVLGVPAHRVLAVAVGGDRQRLEVSHIGAALLAVHGAHQLGVVQRLFAAAQRHGGHERSLAHRVVGVDGHLGGDVDLAADGHREADRLLALALLQQRNVGTGGAASKQGQHRCALHGVRAHLPEHGKVLTVTLGGHLGGTVLIRLGDRGQREVDARVVVGGEHRRAGERVNHAELEEDLVAVEEVRHIRALQVDHVQLGLDSVAEQRRVVVLLTELAIVAQQRHARAADRHVAEAELEGANAVHAGRDVRLEQVAQVGGALHRHAGDAAHHSAAGREQVQHEAATVAVGRQQRLH
mmetsp:Transcript_40912/g.103063  ORF Transcript_40912/g.103063 Transcript_40912/m.103063 type:complete len:432 (+) Transcript_40912:126-1421(+)